MLKALEVSVAQCCGIPHRGLRQATTHPDQGRLVCPSVRLPPIHTLNCVPHAAVSKVVPLLMFHQLSRMAYALS